MQKKWYRLDTAALIFPAIRRRDWCNVFRLSATLADPVDPEILRQAAEDVHARFPSFFVSLRMGFFWYYLEENHDPVNVQADYAYPLTYMSRRELRTCCLRILWYQNRIAVEFFHSLTDGRGGSMFLCTLVARYLERRYGIQVPPQGPVLDWKQAPDAEELEDSFPRYAAQAAAGRGEAASYRLHGTKEPDGFRHLITGTVPTGKLLAAARERHVSVTVLLAAVLARSVMDMQDMERARRRQKPVKLTIPVDMRRIFGSRTVRNFSLVLNLGADPRFGDYSVDELCQLIHHQLRAGATRQNMAGMIAANVQPQQVTLLRLTPAVIKNLVMDLIYFASGERSGSLNLSNLGQMQLPENMQAYVRRMEFIIGPQRSYPNNCSVISCGDLTTVNMIRNIRESELERRFFCRLVELGIPVDIESNDRS